ncbi:MAG: hypothetical protein QOG63_2044, partial [Thermoleophilaceae bacterium]|nr:hypothetical protein [Thermoleophilaceae bacterium]
MFDWTVERERLARALSDPLDIEGSSPRRDGALAVDARYRALVRNLPDTVVAVHDRDLRGVSIDGPVIGRVGFDPDRFEGVALDGLLDADDYERLAPAYRSALEGETVTVEFEYSPTGAVYNLEIVPLRDEASGEIQGVFSVARDVTAQKQAERETRQRAAQQAAVAALGLAALEGTPADELLDEAIVAVASTLEVDLLELLELTDDREQLLLCAGTGWDDGIVGATPVPNGSLYYPGFIWGAKGALVVSDYAEEKRCRATPLLTRHGGAATIGVVVGARQRPYGVLAAHSRAPREFRSDEVDFLQAIANVLAEARGRQEAEERMRHQALHDPLSGLPNRTLLLERFDEWLSRAGRRGGTTAAILFVDIDHFKVVNDALGHERGDELLKTVARRLGGALRPTDTVARVGGDEFVILCEDIDSDHE